MTIKIEQGRFMKTFGTDGDYNPDSQIEDAYLSVKSGEIIEVAINAEALASIYGEETAADMLENNRLVARMPDQFLLIPTMDHGQHHDVIQEFLSGDWTPDVSRRDHVSGVYYPRKSIGCWLREVNDYAAIDAYFKFKEFAILQRAEAFLRSNGITDFVWV